MFAQHYIIEALVCITMLWGLYVGLLHRRIGLRTARVYLLALPAVGALFPLVELPLLPPLPVYTFRAMPVPEYAMIYPLSGMEPIVEQGIDWAMVGRWAVWIWVAGAGITAACMLGGIVREWARTRKSKATYIDGCRVVFGPGVAGAYSVFGVVFLNPKFRGSPLVGRILSHERGHIRAGHTWDLLWINGWRCLMWWNPVVWHLVRLLREVHEFQADRSVLRAGHPVGEYMELLIEAEAGLEAGNYPVLAHPFCYALTKKRLNMIKNHLSRPSRWSAVRLLAIVPVAGALLGAFSLTARAAKEQAEKKEPIFVVDGEIMDKKEVKAWTEQTGGQVKDEGLIFEKGQAENVTVLKGKAAVEQYGKAGKNGVVVIETKDTAQKIEAPTITLRDGKDESKRPLYVVDGEILSKKQIDALSYERSDGAKTLNSENFDQVTVLKGQAAIDMYGEAGKNGAIVIKTKEGKIRKGYGIEVSSNESTSGPVTVTAVGGRRGNYAVDILTDSALRADIYAGLVAVEQGLKALDSIPKETLTSMANALMNASYALSKFISELSADTTQRVWHATFRPIADTTQRVWHATFRQNFAYPVDPAKIKAVSSYGEVMNPTTKKKQFHNGIDFAVDEGENVLASADGVVAEAAFDTERGNYVVIRHAQFSTLYSHLGSLEVEPGNFVKQGQVIGLSGNTGLSGAPHLHYEVHQEGKPVDPRNYLPQ